MDKIFEVKELTVSYEKTAVLWDISLEVPSGSLVGIIGPNGAGKSTLIKASLNLVKPLSGSVLFFGKPLEQVKSRVGYVPQRESVDWDFPITVLELVLMGSYGRLGLMRFPGKAIKKRACELLEQVGLEAYRERQISQLSGGQQQRAFLARALLQECDLYFMDEPFAGIDFATAQVIFSLLTSLKQQGKTVIVVHHDLSSIREYFDWVIMLNMRLIAAGPTASTFTASGVEKTFGKSHALFDEAVRIAEAKTWGL